MLSVIRSCVDALLPLFFAFVSLFLVAKAVFTPSDRWMDRAVCVELCCLFSRRDEMRAARSVESLDMTGRPGPHTDLARSFDDQQLHDALSEQRVGPGPPTSRRQPPGQYTRFMHHNHSALIGGYVILTDCLSADWLACLSAELHTKSQADLAQIFTRS